MLIDVGLFDESLIRNQDYEMNRRIREAGYDVFFAPELRVRYRPRGSFGTLWRQYFSYGRWKRLVVRRDPRSVRPRQLAAPALIAGLLASACLAVTPYARIGLAIPLGYLVTVVGATGFELVRHRDGAAVLVVVVLPAMHLAWGTGFWRSGTGDPAPIIPVLEA